MTAPRELLDRMTRLRVLVIGEAMLDTYLSGRATRLTREAPVPIVAVRTRTDAPGGAANAAVNVAQLGARVDFLSVLGDDADAATLRRALEVRGVSDEHLVADRDRQTLTKRRVSADGQLLVRFDQGTTEALAPAAETTLIERLRALFRAVDAVLISDYAYGVLTPGVIETMRELQEETPRPLVVDAKDATAYRGIRLTAAKPNYAEAVRLLGEPESDVGPVRVGQIARSAERLLDAAGAPIVAVTLDRDGAVILERGQPAYRTYARPRAHSRAAGAGDTFVSAFTLALAAGAETTAAAELAAAASSIVVDKDGTAFCSAAELRDLLVSRDKYLSDIGELHARVRACEATGKRVVFTNGCFDILHRGHITYLNRAKALGDVLIVGLNADASVRRLKGPDRPINTLEDRAEVLAALSAVDHIVPFEDDTAAELIRVIRPRVYVKGGDYTREALPEAPLVESLGGTVQILAYVEDRSTSRIIERVRAGEGTG